ncbi:MAG: PD-(D/E)XK nuclease family protein, partial [Draconibacterium sp.]|nr:PD-(D/E)XK nuclease family protein [Draconibacterium sp.]
MERFLSQAAKYIYEKHSNELHKICVVFPNRRSGVFFTSYLQKEISGSVLAPATTTISELISGYSNLFQGEKLQLISILFEVFKKHTQTTETFDEFYFWGEILLADFNDIDRYLVNAKDIFTNISDIKEIEYIFDYLTNEQKEALEHFWGSVAVSGRKEFQEKHLAIWKKLYPIYSEFKKILTEKNIAFGGMIDREVVENLKEKDFNFDFNKYYFVGLNALNSCEQKFFTHLSRQKKAEFLWDFDKAYLHDKKNEAGRFMRENLKRFPPPFDFIFDSEILDRNKNIKIAAVSSTYGQSQQIPKFLLETKSDFSKQFDNTAIVLADESLLFSSLGAIPDDIGTVNITMGYPVKNSMIYGFLMLLVNLLKNKKTDKKRGIIAYHRYVTDILNHQLLRNWETEKGKEFIEDVRLRNRITIELDEINFTQFHKTMFSLPGDVENYSRYFLEVLDVVYNKLNSTETNNKMLLEIIYSIYQAIEKLESVIKNVTNEQNREISEAVYFRLFSQYLGKVSVAFEGEPLSGIQVMGILETRCLDFKNIIILGLNENKWPRTYTAPSFIPFNIRKGFGLPGIDEQDAMYSYYFYRLIQRAKNVTATYSVVKEGISTGELSRYGYQLQYDSAHQPKLVNLDFSFSNDPNKPIEIESSRQISNILLNKNTYEHPLSPSAINTYLQCSLRFYFRYVVGLPEPDEVKEEIDAIVFGNIFHDTIEAIYKPFVGKVLNESDLDKIKDNRIFIENEIRKQIAHHYFKEKKSGRKPVILEGKTLLVYENIKTYLNQLLTIDKDITPFTMVSLEHEYHTTFDIDLNGNQTTINIGGKIDRVDRVNGITRVLDYKTGDIKTLEFKEIEDLFERDIKEPKKEILQAMIYSWALSENSDNLEIQPVIYSLRKLFNKNYSPNIEWKKHDFSFQELENDLVKYLKELVKEIYSTENRFTQTEHTDKCKYCA